MKFVSVPNQDTLYLPSLIKQQIDPTRINLISVATRAEAAKVSQILDAFGIKNINYVAAKASCDKILAHLTSFRNDGDDIFFYDRVTKKPGNFEDNNVCITTHNVMNLINSHIVKGDAFTDIPKEVFAAIKQTIIGLPGSFFEHVKLTDDKLTSKLFNDEILEIIETEGTNDAFHTIRINDNDIQAVFDITSNPSLEKLLNFQKRGYTLKVFDSEYQKMISKPADDIETKLTGKSMLVCCYLKPQAFKFETTLLAANIQDSLWALFTFPDGIPSLEIIPGMKRTYNASSLKLHFDLSTNKKINSEYKFDEEIYSLVQEYGQHDRNLEEGRWFTHARVFELKIINKLIKENKSALLFRSKLRPTSEAASNAFANLIKNMVSGTNAKLFHQGKTDAPLMLNESVDTLYVYSNARTANKLFGFLDENGYISDESRFWISDILAYLEMYPGIKNIVFASDMDLNIWEAYFGSQSTSDDESDNESVVIDEEIAEPEPEPEQEQEQEPEPEQEPTSPTKALVYGTPEYCVLFNKPFDFSEVDDKPSKEELLAKKIANKVIKKLMNEQGMDIVDANHIKKNVLNASLALVVEIGFDKIDLESSVNNVIELFIDTPTTEEIILEEIAQEDDIANYFPIEEQDDGDNIDGQEEAEDSEDDFDIVAYFSK